MSGSQVFSVVEVAELLGVHPATVRRLVARGDVPAIRVGAAVRVPRTFVEGLLASATTAPAAPAAADEGVSGA